MSHKELRYYETDSGEKPFIKWFQKLDKQEQITVTKYLDRVAYSGSQNNIKALKGGIFEIRIFLNSGLRVYFGEDGNEIILLLIGGNKRTQDSDILKARKYWRNYGKKRIV